MLSVFGWTLRYRRIGSDPQFTDRQYDASINREILTDLKKGACYEVKVAATNSRCVGMFSKKTVKTCVDRKLYIICVEFICNTTFCYIL